MFQSPSGVLGVCRYSIDAVLKAVVYRFQSPSGVLGVCRHEKLIELIREQDRLVSVPFRGFRGLQEGRSPP